MTEESKKSLIRMIEETFSNPKARKKLSIFIDGNGGDVYDKKPSQEILRIPLSKMNIIALESRPQIIDLPIGNYKLTRDHITSHISDNIRITDYERFY